MDVSSVFKGFVIFFRGESGKVSLATFACF